MMYSCGSKATIIRGMPPVRKTGRVALWSRYVTHQTIGRITAAHEDNRDD
jgi:hypothetical protein